MKPILIFILFVLFLCLLLMTNTGCRPKLIHVPVHRDSISYQVRTDSVLIYRHDSIFIRVANDTVLIERFRTLVRHRDRSDTIFQEIITEIPFPVEVIRTQVPQWAWWLLGLMLLQVAWWIIRIRKK